MSALFQSKKALYGSVAALVVVLAALAWFLLSDREYNPMVLEGQRIVVTVHAAELDDVYGYQFHLNYNPNQVEWAGSLTSKVEDITLIFSRSFNTYELVGATMIGEREGVSGRNVEVAELVLIADMEAYLLDFDISISHVNVVRSDMEYLEDVEGWSLSFSVQEAE